MATTSIFTAVDVVDHLMDVMGGGSTDAQTLRKCKRAMEAAYRAFPTLRAWTYYHTYGSLIVNEYYNTGTIAYDHTGGTYERMMTLTSGTWPTWAKYGFVRIDRVNYEVATRESSTVITLSVNNNPGADITAGESYEIFRDTYPLPVNFTSMGLIRDPVNSWHPQYLPPNEFMSLKTSQESANRPRNFTIIADQNYFGTLAIRFYPPPDDDYNYEYLYRRNPRQLGTYQYRDGTVTTSGTTVTGTSTAFTQDMVGCVFRPGSSATTYPTGTTGTAPYREQRIITSWTSSTVIGIDQALSTEVTGVKYEISDPIDIESGAMYTAFLKHAEWELAMLMKRDDIERYDKLRREAEVFAAESDSRSFDRPGTGLRRRTPMRFPVIDG